jgi:hypothetical protein
MHLSQNSNPRNFNIVIYQKIHLIINSTSDNQKLTIYGKCMYIFQTMTQIDAGIQPILCWSQTGDESVFIGM